MALDVATIFYDVGLPLLLLLFLTKLVIFVSTSRTRSSKNLPPSPLALPIVGHLHLLKGLLHLDLARLADRYGPVILLRFGRLLVLVVSSPAAARECFTRNDLAFANRPRLPSWKLPSDDYTAIGAASYGPHWRNMRRISTAEVLSAHRLDSFSGSRADEVKAMVRDLFRDHLAGRETANLREGPFQLAVNTVMTMVAGKRYYDGTVTEEGRTFQTIVRETFALLGVANLSDFLPFLGLVDFGGLKRRWMRLAKARSDFLQGLIDERRKEMSNEKGGEEDEKKQHTMISVLLTLQKTSPDYYTDSMIKSLINTMLTAGTDTSSITMEWGMALLLNHQEKMKKAKAEIDDNVGNNRLIQESDLPNLPYLHGIVSETLRLYSPAPLLLPHESLEDCIVGGYNVSRGTMLLVNMHSIHRDPNAWVDPNSFMPERYDNRKGPEATLFAPFGMGRRQCPGEGLAIRSVSMVLGTLIQCFEWERLGTEEVDMSQKAGLTFPKAIPLEARFRPHQNMLEVLSAL